jgi:hypothetical protein
VRLNGPSLPRNVPCHILASTPGGTIRFRERRQRCRFSVERMGQRQRGPHISLGPCADLTIPVAGAFAGPLMLEADFNLPVVPGKAIAHR